nr:MAG TPA: hypothetical protein [Caudoviricetes sp.]DAY21458.1 MAG TPA: hypothetical protein [Caudoviricetes sp.]
MKNDLANFCSVSILKIGAERFALIYSQFRSDK